LAETSQGWFLPISNFKSISSPFQLRIRDLLVHNHDGNFSLVFKGKATRISEDGTQEEPFDVAVKKILVERTQIIRFREVYLLRQLTTQYPHKNIVKLLYTQRKKYESNMNVLLYFLVFRFMPNTLAHLIANGELSGQRNALDMKMYIWQLFAGLNHLRKVGRGLGWAGLAFQHFPS
jgi:hypothetical protein